MEFSPNEKGDISGFINILFQCPFPDTLQIPENGWSREWMKKNFPNYANIESFRR